MKRSLLFVIAVGWLFSSGLQAAPIYYTFEGNINSTYDGSGQLAAKGIGVGDAINYTIMVDYALQGSFVHNNGTLYTRPDSSGCLNCTTDSFYADYISGSALIGVPSTHPNAIAEYNLGYNSLCWSCGAATYYHYSGSLYVGPGSSNSFYSSGLNFYSANSNISSLTIGDVLSVNDAMDGLNYTFSSLSGTVRVTNISTVYTPSSGSVPEPATFLMLGLGMIGIRRACSAKLR